MAVSEARRPTFWEWRAELERSRDRLWAAALGLGVACAVLATLVVWQALRPRPIYYISGVMGTAWPGQIPDSVAEEFAARVVTLMGNLNASTARRVYELAGRYLTPALSARVSLQGKSDLETIEAQRLGMAFVQTDVAVVEKASDPPTWALVVKGTRTTWAGQQLLSQDPVEYTVHVVRVSATELNPYGLAVDAFQLRTLAAEARRQ